MDDFLTYEQVESLKKGDRILFRNEFGGGYMHGVVHSKGTSLGGPSVWVQVKNTSIQMNITTGMDQTKDYWEKSRSSTKFKFAPVLSHEG